MSWFGNPFRKKKTISTTEPTFGDLTFDRGIWAHIPNTPGDFMITIDASEAGPSIVQREFFEGLRAKLPSLGEIAREHIRRVAESVPNVGSLKVYSVEIGSDSATLDRRFVLELTDDSEDMIHRVTFESNRPIHYTFDH